MLHPEQKEAAIWATDKRTLLDLDTALSKLINFKAIQRCNAVDDQFLSPIFLRDKSDGSKRLILNLKHLNEFIRKEHFKIEDMRTALNILDVNDYMCKLDLKDAYLSVPIHKDHKKFLRFEHRNELYEFNALPFGLTSAPFVFTKLLKPALTWLRTKGVRLVVYIDDFLIFGSTIEECIASLNLTSSLLTSLGFPINWEKCALIPKRSCTFLGLTIHSREMLLELPPDKRNRIKSFIKDILKSRKIKVQTVAVCIGTLVAACPAVAYGWLFYKNLEKDKRRALILYKGNTNAFTTLSTGSLRDLHWWADQISQSNNKIRTSSYDMEIYSDASKTGWGAVCAGQEANGLWNESESGQHINFLEIKAAYLALKCFARRSFDKQILLRIDNITALAYINKMGGIKFAQLNDITNRLWKWCMGKKIWVFAEFVASENNLADEGSRLNNPDTEWELSDAAFKEICRTFGNPTIDLFATRINTKCTRYYS